MQNSSSAFCKHALVRQPCMDGSWLARLLFTQDFAGSALWAFTAKKVEKNVKKELTKDRLCVILTKSVAGVRKQAQPVRNGILAQLGEHLPYKQRVIGSSPIGPIPKDISIFADGIITVYGEIAQLARAHGSYPWCRGFKSPSRYFVEHPIIADYRVFLLLNAIKHPPS